MVSICLGIMKKYPEEKIALGLFKRLNKRFKNSDLNISIEGDGVHWHVDAQRSNRIIRVHCFDYGIKKGTMFLGLRGNKHISKVCVDPDPSRP